MLLSGKKDNMLKELIDQFYLERDKEKDQRHFYITDAGKCGRAIFFKFKKAPREEMEARVLRMFDYGDYIHRFIMKPLLAKKEVRVVSAEVNIDPQELISGRADAIISDGKELYVLDIKSINGMIFNSLTQPKEDHLDQIQLYLHFFKRKKGILLYVNKDTLELKEFPVDYDSVRSQKLLQNLSQLKIKIDRNIIPSRLPNWPDNWRCQYCQFKEICRMAGTGELDWAAFKSKIEGQASEN